MNLKPNYLIAKRPGARQKEQDRPADVKILPFRHIDGHMVYDLYFINYFLHLQQ